jgi:hypothetical protein
MNVRHTYFKHQQEWSLRQMSRSKYDICSRHGNHMSFYMIVTGHDSQLSTDQRNGNSIWESFETIGVWRKTSKTGRKSTALEVPAKSHLTLSAT